MADQKISELTALTGANVADDDAIAIVDTSATETKKIVFSELKNALDTATGFVRITGDTMTGDLNVLANVGIGTSSPSRKLSVYDSSAPYLALQNSTSGSASGDGFQVQLAAANSYLWNYENGFTSFGTNNTEAMRIDSSGNVGIGTSSPSAALHVDSSNDGPIFDSGGTGNTNHALLVRDSGNNQLLRVDNNGNVGIGTSSPSYPLHVSGTGDKVMAVTAGASSIAALNLGNSTNLADGGIRYDNSADALILRASNAEKMRIDSSGNVGVGTSSPVTSYKNALQVHGADGGGNIRITNDTTGTGTGNGFEAVVVGVDAYLIQREAAPLIFYTSSTEAMRITSAGNVGIGTSSPSQKLEVSDTTTATVIVRVTNNDGNAEMQKHQEHLYINLNDTGNIFFRSGSTITERMRLDASGNLLVGTTLTSEVDESGTRIVVGDAGFIEHSRTSTTDTLPNVVLARGNDGEAIRFIRNDGSNREVGDIVLTTSATSYNTSSDHRLKENVVELTGATTRLKQLEPKRFNFIADADTTVDGFIAHEVQSVVPEAITGTHNEVDDDGNPVYQGIDQSKLVPLLVATIKELEARITALENA